MYRISFNFNKSYIYFKTKNSSNIKMLDFFNFKKLKEILYLEKLDSEQ